jgi:hypothetical protein
MLGSAHMMTRLSEVYITVNIAIRWPKLFS